MSTPCCCPTTKLASQNFNYVPKGKFQYRAKPPQGTPVKARKVLLVPDIFGFHPATVNFADQLAAAGYEVAFEDYFENGCWPWDKPLEGEDWNKFVGYITSPAIFARVKESAEKLKAETEGGLEPLMVGFCWGPKAGSVELMPNKLVAGAALVHPSFCDEAVAKASNVPTAIFASKDENKEEMEKMKNVLTEKGFMKPETEYGYYEKCSHGWCAARYDPNSESDKQARDEVIAKTIAFFNRIQ